MANKIKETSMPITWQKTIKLLNTKNARALTSQDRFYIFHELEHDIKNISNTQLKILCLTKLYKSKLVTGHELKYALKYNNTNGAIKHDNLITMDTIYDDKSPVYKKPRAYFSERFTNLHLFKDFYTHRTLAIDKIKNSKSLYRYMIDDDSNLHFMTANNVDLIDLLSACIRSYKLVLNKDKLQNKSLNDNVDKLIIKYDDFHTLLKHAVRMYLARNLAIGSKERLYLHRWLPWSILDPEKLLSGDPDDVYNNHFLGRDVLSRLHKFQMDYNEHLIKDGLNDSPEYKSAVINIISNQLKQLNDENIVNIGIITELTPVLLKELIGLKKITLTDAFTIAIQQVKCFRDCNDMAETEDKFTYKDCEKDKDNG